MLLLRSSVLRLLPMAAALAIGGWALSFAPPGSVGPPWALALLAVAALAWVLLQAPDLRRDDALPALAVLLSALGLSAIARLSAELAHRQEMWLGIALALVLGLGPWLRRYRVLAAFKYIWILGSIVLFALVAVFGVEVNGARLWIGIGSVRFEPIEVIKLFLVFFMSAYLAETADVIANARPWSLRANAKYLGPLFIGWGSSMAILVFQRDLGMAILLLATFAAMLYVATRRIDLIVGGIAVFAFVVFWAASHYAYVHTRIAVWLNPFADPLGAGYQTIQALFSIAAGGLFGTGYGLGHPGYVPDVATDYIYAAWTEELGAFGALVLCAVFFTIVVHALGVAARQPDLYSKLLASGLAATLGFQVVIIVGGVLRLFPLTGITLPFFSYGGSSLVANFILIALIWTMSARRIST